MCVPIVRHQMARGMCRVSLAIVGRSTPSMPAQQYAHTLTQCCRLFQSSGAARGLLADPCTNVPPTNVMVVLVNAVPGIRVH